MLNMKQDVYTTYIGSAIWQQRQSRFLAKHKRCFVCNNPKDLEVHHKTYARLGCEYNRDLVTLCVKHHGELHNRNLPIFSGHIILKQQWKGTDLDKRKFLGVPATANKNKRKRKARRERKRIGKRPGGWLAIYPDPDYPNKCHPSRRLGVFKTAETAARAYDIAALNNGGFGALNFPVSCYKQNASGFWFDPERIQKKPLSANIIRYHVDPILLHEKSGDELDYILERARRKT